MAPRHAQNSAHAANCKACAPQHNGKQQQSFGVTCAQAVGSGPHCAISCSNPDFTSFTIAFFAPKSGGWSCSLLCPLPRRKSATISGWKLEKWKTSKVLGEDDACKVFFCADDSLRFFCCKARIWRRSCKLHGFGIASLGNMKNGMQIICLQTTL